MPARHFEVGRIARLGCNTAFVLTLAGISGMYCEFVRPGLFVPGLVGIALAVFGASQTWACSPSATGLVLLCAAGALFIAECVWDTRLVLGICGGILLATGFYFLFQGQERISPALDVPVCTGFSFFTIFLAQGARRARRNKRADLG